ncbi:GRB10-interacting GYF protein 2 isoform X2 [Periplaneta americana]|uniref:GRB10-interacting GYF protein 2 isoform X2 n=1 Tax=Periplaneta americana TaxID=6978 RepID=UPI0037E80103
MTDSMKFGPEWLRNLSQDGCTQPSVPSTPRYQLAEHRYGREEMLALFDHMVKAPDPLVSIPSLYVEKIQEPLALQQMTEEETRMWNRGINSDAVLRSSGKVPSGISGGPRGGRGGSVDRGRGRGRGGYHYTRGLSYEEPGDGVDSRGGLRVGLDRDRIDGPISSATSFPRNIRPFDRPQGTLTDRGWSERNGVDTGDWNGSTSPRKDFGGGRGFMSDNWRRHRAGEDEEGWRTATNSRSDKWIRSNSWREGDKDGSEMERDRSVTGGRGQGWERGRSWDEPGSSAPSHHPHRRPWDEDNLPEWANENPSESGGSFDASGAFHGGGGFSEDEEVSIQDNTGSGNHSRESRTKLLSDSSGTKRVHPGSTGPSRRMPGSTGNSNNSHDREESGRSLDVEGHSAPADRLVNSVPTLPSSSQVSKIPSKPPQLDTNTRPVSMKKTSPPPASQPVPSADKMSVSSDSVPSSGKPDSTSSIFTAGNSVACINNVMSNCVEPDTLKVGPTVASGEVNGCEHDRVLTKVEVRPQTLAVGRQKSEDDMDHMQEVADDLVAKLMDDEEGQDKLTPSLQQTPVTEKWFYRDPQGEVQGPFLSGEMAEWFRAGYFTLNLLVRRSCDECYSQLGDLIKLWGRVPFMPGPTFPPIKPADTVSTSVSTTVQPTMTQGVTTPTLPSGLDQESLLMQQYQYQLLQRQFLLRQQAVAGKLSQTERWSTLSPLEQQQLIMQQMLSQPVPPQQPVDPGLSPFMQQMAAHTHKNPVMHLLSQLHQPKVPTTSVPDSQHSPTQSQAPVLEPLQQLIQQMGGLQQQQPPPNTTHQSLLHPQPLSVPDSAANKTESEPNPIQMLIRHLGNKAAKPQLESVWGGNMSPGPAAAAAAAAAFTAQNWLGQMPTAPPGQLPPSSMWELHGKDVKTEQQILEEQIRAEEERRRDELRKQEETQRRTEEEEKKRKQLEEELRKKEAEKQRLEEQMQKLEEEKKEEERRRKEEERKRLEEKRRLEEKLRQEEEQKRKLAEEAERKRQQEEAKRLEEERAAQKREEAARRKEEERKRKEEEKEKKRKLEEERKREEEEKRRVEEEQARKKQQQDEEERRLEQQRRQTEALRRLQEQQQQRAKAAPWSQQTPGTSGSSLADIQRQEKEKKERELREQQQQLLLQLHQQQQQQLQQQQQIQAQGNNNSLQLKWAERKPVPAGKVKSLAEIQAEEQEQLAKQERERAERAQQQKEVSLPPSAGIWGTASQSLSWTSSGAGTTTVWGSTAPATTGVVGFWDEVVPSTVKPAGKATGKAKPGTASTSAGNNSSGKTGSSKTRSKKEEALVMKLFEQNVPRGDEFTQWCNKALSGLQSSVDIPTFVGFLRDIESPYEVKDYVRLYLGEGKEAQEFARQFLERRSKWKSAQRAVPLEDDMCIPAPAVNPLNTDFQEVKGKGKKAKKSKMFRVDNRILGFNVTAAQDRINVGDRDYGEGM